MIPPRGPIAEYLADVRKTVRRRLLAYGAFAVLAGGVTALLVIVFLDWLLWLPAILRVLGSTLFFAGFGWASWHWVVQPMRARIGWVELASQLERRLHAPQDLLSSTVGFLQQPDTASNSMVRRVVADTERMIRELPLSDALSTRPVAIRGATLAGVMLLLAAIQLASPDWMRTGIARYARPWTDTAWPRRVLIRPISSDQTVALGESATVRMAVDRGLYDSLRGVVRLRDTHGQQQILTLHRDADGTFSTTVDAITEELTYWFEAGDDDTRERASILRVVRRPEVLEALATVEPPAYAPQRSPKTVDLRSGSVSAMIGGTVTLSLRSSAPVDAGGGPEINGLRAESGELLPFTIDPADARNLSASFEVTEDVTFRPELRDENGFSNRGAGAYMIRATPDRPPTVTVLEPAAVAEVTPTGSLRVQIRVEDDLGIEQVELRAEGLADGRTNVTPLTNRLNVTRSDDVVEGFVSYMWNLSSLGVASGDALWAEVTALDNRAEPAGPAQVGRSAPFRIKIIAQAELELRLREDLNALEARLRQIILDESAVRDKTAGVVDALRENGGVAATDRESIIQLVGTQSRVAQQTRDVGNRLFDLVARMQRNHAGDDKSRARLADAAEVLRRTVPGAMTEASDRLGRAAEPGPTESQQEHLEVAGSRQDDSLHRLNEVLQSLSQWGAFQGLVTRMRDLLDRQNAVRTQTAEQGSQTMGKSADALAPEEAAALKRLERQQEQIADDVERHLTNLEQLADGTKDKDPAGAAAIEDALRAGRASDVSRRVRAAVEAIRGNRTAAATLDQKAAAEAMRKMIAALRERDDRELAELRKRLERAEDLVANLLEQQRALRTVTQEAASVGGSDETLELTEAEQRTLARNARMLAGDIAEAPRAASAARRVRQSAEPMTRAEGRLRAKLPGDAVPPQDEAIQQLSDALAELEEMGRETEEQALRRTLSQVYDDLDAILLGQRAVNDGITKLRIAVDAAGKLGRAEAREAVKLSKSQSDVRQMVADLSPELEKVPVYDWALQRVAKWMDASRSRLDDRALDDELTATTDRIVRELEKLANALVETQKLPSIQEFAEAEMSGGGDEGDTAKSAAIPTVAELLVLRTMQSDIRDRTRTLNQDYDPQSAAEAQLRKLAELGEDQNEVRRLTELVTSRSRGAQGP